MAVKYNSRAQFSPKAGGVRKSEKEGNSLGNECICGEGKDGCQVEKRCAKQIRDWKSILHCLEDVRTSYCQRCKLEENKQ